MQTADSDVILAIDDDDAVRASLRFALEIEGFAVGDYRSGEDLLSADVVRGAACLLVDYRLPGIDGVALVSELRARGICCPAILMTTNPTAEIRQRASNAGVTIVEKPLFGNGLAEAIQNAIGRAAVPGA